MASKQEKNAANTGQEKTVPAVALDFGGALAGPKAAEQQGQSSDWGAVLNDPPCGPNSKNPATRLSLF